MITYQRFNTNVLPYRDHITHKCEHNENRLGEDKKGCHDFSARNILCS